LFDDGSGWTGGWLLLTSAEFKTNTTPTQITSARLRLCKARLHQLDITINPSSTMTRRSQQLVFGV